MVSHYSGVSIQNDEWRVSEVIVVTDMLLRQCCADEHYERVLWRAAQLYCIQMHSGLTGQARLTSGTTAGNEKLVEHGTSSKEM